MAISDAAAGVIRQWFGNLTWQRNQAVADALFSIITTANASDATLNNVATDRLLGRDTAGTGAVEQLTVGGGLAFTGLGGIQTAAFTGDVTKSLGGTALTIANDAVTFAKMQNASGASVLVGRGAGAGAGDFQEITLGTGLSMSGTTLNGTAATSPGGSSGQVQYNNAGSFGGFTVGGDATLNTGTGALTVNQAAKWTTARTLSFTGDATGSGSVDGSANVATALTLANSGVSAGTYGSTTAIPVITFDAKGRATAASTVAVTSTAFAPLTTGAEPIVLVSDGAGQCIMVPIA